jgi:hypothetical protein
VDLLDQSQRGRYGSPPSVKNLGIPAFAWLCAVLVGCGDAVPERPPPEARAFWPTGLALRRTPGGQNLLYIASSNSDLRYDHGTLLSVDADQSGDSFAVLGRARLANFAGELAVVDADSCSGWTGQPLAMVASRADGLIQRIGLGDDGSLTCESGVDQRGWARCHEPCPAGGEAGRCALRIREDLADPYGVTPACLPGTATPFKSFVTHLRAPAGLGWLTEIDLLTGARGEILLGVPGTEPAFGWTHASAFDPFTGHLLVTHRFVSRLDHLWMRVLDAAAPTPEVLALDLFGVVKGAESRGLAIWRDPAVPERGLAFLAYRHPDALLVLDLTPSSGSGMPTMRVLEVVPMPAEPTEVRVIPRAAGRPLVAVSCPGSDALVIYDDESRKIASVIGPSRDGHLPLGRQPYGLALMPDPSTTVPRRLFVGTFEGGWVSEVHVDPAAPHAAVVARSLGFAQ